ncbi:MAG: hypothetical protein C0402_04850 [Thermodesulfovibrio sp.]|nr:hypothetical protein [Thermodesulfovibrio sp.]
MLVNSTFLNPNALFGVEGLDKWSHSLFWGLLLNVVCYFGVSIFTGQDSEEEKQALMFVESYTPRVLPVKSSYSTGQIEEILGQYIGRREAHEIVESFLQRYGIKRELLNQNEFILLRGEAERVLSGAMGTAIATIILEDKLTLTEQERGDLSNSIKQMTETLRLSRQELAVANRNLAYLKEFSENIIESAPVGIVTLDGLLRIRYWNREIETLTGINKAEASNRSLVTVLPWLNKEVIQQAEQRDEIIVTPKALTFKVNVSPFKDPSGGYVVIFEDITEKRKMEEQLLQSSKLASLGKMTAGISHEIGNPLASISSLIQELTSLKIGALISPRGGVSEANADTDRQLLNKSEQEAEFIEDSLKTINGHIERIAKIVRSLGDFARTSSREKVLSPLGEILDRTLNLVRYDKRFRNIQMETEIGSLPLVRVNPDQIQQVFLNLMLNAIDAMPEGGKLTIAMHEAGNMIIMKFSDTGAGIDEAVIDRIFDPFFTTKPLGKGTGLGLSICYGIIKEHGGTISVNSTRGSGTIFTIRIPL